MFSGLSLIHLQCESLLYEPLVSLFHHLAELGDLTDKSGLVSLLSPAPWGASCPLTAAGEKESHSQRHQCDNEQSAAPHTPVDAMAPLDGLSLA